MNNQYTSVKTFNKKLIPIIIIVVILLIIIFSSIAIVPAGSTGVVTTFGKVSDTVMQEGFNLKIPFVQNVVTISNKIQKEEVEAAAVSKDLQSIRSVIAVNYRVGLKSSANIYKNIGADYEGIVLLPAMHESVKSISAKYTAEELITKRANVGVEIKEALESKVSMYGIVIEGFNIVNFDFSQDFDAAIEAKQVAEQNLIKTKTEQEEKIVIAEADAKQKVISAKADADSIKAKADAQAEANKKIINSINENVLEYEKIQKWDGKLPISTGGDSIIDIRENDTKKAD